MIRYKEGYIRLERFTKGARDMLKPHSAMEAISFFSQHLKDTNLTIQPTRIIWANQEEDMTLTFFLEHTGWKRPNQAQEDVCCYSPLESTSAEDLFSQWFNIPRWQILSPNTLNTSVQKIKQEALAKLQARVNKGFPSMNINTIDVRQETASLQCYVRESIGRLHRPTKDMLINAVRLWKPSLIATATDNAHIPIYLENKESLTTCLPTEIVNAIVKLALAV